LTAFAAGLNFKGSSCFAIVPEKPACFLPWR
jgi:hypothetical protein